MDLLPPPSRSPGSDIAGVSTSRWDGQTVLRTQPEALSELALQAFHDGTRRTRYGGGMADRGLPAFIAIDSKGRDFYDAMEPVISER